MYTDLNLAFQASNAAQEAPGSWTVTGLQHNGHFTGQPYSPPGTELPKLQPNGKQFSTAPFQGKLMLDTVRCKVQEYINLGSLAETGPMAIYQALQSV